MRTTLRWDRRRQRAAVAGVALAAVVVPAGVAFAEGSFNSSLSGVRDGYESRRWVDNNNDAAGTVTTVAGCSSDTGATFYITVELRKDQFGPDKSYGTSNYSACNRTSQQYNWGRPGAGTFFDRIGTYTFGTVSASTFNVSY